MKTPKAKAAKPKRPQRPTFFARPADFRKWLEANHERETELLVGLHKKESGRASITWPESVAEVLCFGWIDGVRRSIDERSYSIRFTPRKTTSIWSTVNLRKMQELIADGLVRPAGMRAFERRSAEKSEIYAYENRNSAVLDADMEKHFRRNRAAWKFFERCPPWYRRTAIWRIISAKRPETRAKRLAELIDCCAAGKSLPTLRLSSSVEHR